MLDYLFDVVIFSLPLLMPYVLFWVLLFSIAKIFKLKLSEQIYNFKVFIVGALLLLFVAGTNQSITWKNDLNSTAADVSTIQQYNAARQIPKIVDNTKQPTGISEEEMKNKTNWKEENKNE
jgi:energy-coupling factor transporter transmembrane protein EcfT